MTISNSGAPPWSSSRSAGAAPVAPDAWHATRAQTSLVTQIVRDKDDYLSTEKGDVGRNIGPNERELFVSCDAGPALQQQLEHLRPEFIVVHDIGTASSRKLLSGIAAASGRAVQKLVIRRQGYGKALATLYFIELPAAGGLALRMYTTESEADPAARLELGRSLLAFSRLGVVMVGDLTPEALRPSLKALRDDIIGGPWHNRHLLMLPLASASNLAAQGLELAQRTGVSVRTTPMVTRPAEAWGFISDTWRGLSEPDGQESESLEHTGGPSLSGVSAFERPHVRVPTPAPSYTPAPGPRSSPPALVEPAAARLNGSTYVHLAPRTPQAPPAPPVAASPAPRNEPPVLLNGASPARPAAPPTPASSLSLRALPPSARAAEFRAVAPTLPMELPEHAKPQNPPQLQAQAKLVEQSILPRYVRVLGALNGMASCCVFDVVTGKKLAQSGAAPNPGELGRQGQALIAAMLESSHALGCGHAMPEAAITLETHHLLLRAVPHHPGLALHAVFDKATANLTLARLQVLRLDALFEDAPRGA